MRKSPELYQKRPHLRPEECFALCDQQLLYSVEPLLQCNNGVQQSLLAIFRPFMHSLASNWIAPVLHQLWRRKAGSQDSYSLAPKAPQVQPPPNPSNSIGNRTVHRETRATGGGGVRMDSMSSPWRSISSEAKLHPVRDHEPTERAGVQRNEFHAGGKEVVPKLQVMVGKRRIAGKMDRQKDSMRPSRSLFQWKTLTWHQLGCTKTLNEPAGGRAPQWRFMRHSLTKAAA